MLATVPVSVLQCFLCFHILKKLTCTFIVNVFAIGMPSGILFLFSDLFHCCCYCFICLAH